MTTTVDIPDWFQTQAGNPNSVEAQLLQYVGKTVLIPLNNGPCRVDPGTGNDCPADKVGADPVGNNTWHYVHTLANFYFYEIDVQGSNVDRCKNPPGTPPVLSTDTSSGFVGCFKGWFVNYLTSGPIVPGGIGADDRGHVSVAIQLIK